MTLAPLSFRQTVQAILPPRSPRNQPSQSNGQNVRRGQGAWTANRLAAASASAPEAPARPAPGLRTAALGLGEDRRGGYDQTGAAMADIAPRGSTLNLSA